GYLNNTLKDTNPSAYEFTSNTVPATPFIVSDANAGVYNVYYTFVSTPLTEMPTISSINTGSIYQANATTTSTLTGNPGQAYNSTFQYFSFQIPLAPGTNYTTVIWNSTWTLSNAFPSTFLPISAGQNYITFEDLSGFSFIQVQLIEPSSLINTMEQVQLSPYQSRTGQSLGTFSSYFSISVSYTPFGSSTAQTINPSSEGFSLPYGSIASAYLYDPWHQLVGSEAFNVSSTYVQVGIPLNVTFVYFVDEETNATFSGETISANGYNNTYPDPMVVANGSSYQYTVSTVDPATSLLKAYSGSFTASGAVQEAYVKVGKPPGTVQLSVYQKQSGESLSQYSSYLNVTVSYLSPGSASPIEVEPLGMSVQLPQGSTATAYVYNPWQQLMGYVSFNVTGQYSLVSIPLNATLAYLIDQQTSAAFPEESLSSNGYNNTYPDPMVVANGSSYQYAVSAINPQTYQLENYPGIFTAKGTSQKIYVNVGMPLASALVNVYAYNGSGIGLLGNAGPSTGSPTAYLYIGGVLQSLSSTFTGELGQTYPVQVTDVLGDVLYTGNLTLNQPTKTVDIYVRTPSYGVQFINEEAVPASSPLATQFSSINPIGKDVYVNFSTRVGQESTLYFATGSYHLYTHDNLTDSLNFTLVNETIGYDFNGPNILRITEQAINSTNHGIILNPISQPGNLIPGQNATWLLEPEFKNGTLLTPSQIENSTFQFIVTNSSGFFLPEIVDHSIVQGYLRVTFLPTVNGSMTFATKETFDNNSGSYSDQVSVIPIVPASVGLQDTITLPSTIQAGNATVGTVFFSLDSSNSSNPATPDQGQTLSIMHNTTLELLANGKFDGLIAMYYIQPGEAAFSLNITATGTGYAVLAITTPTGISGQKVSFTGSSSSFSVVSYNPTKQVSLTSQLEKALTGLDAEIFYLIVTVVTVLYEVIKYLRRGDEEEDTEDNEAGLFMEAMTMFQVILLNAEKKPVPPELNDIYTKIPAKRRNKIYGLITSRRRAILPKPKFLMRKPKEAKQNE
ncbi:MAG: hypothetical protein KHF84_09820, partial [Thermoplasmata archaeon]|nr:hypothetical protein [Candidatus Sysuiplasma jiujiangense]